MRPIQILEHLRPGDLQFVRYVDGDAHLILADHSGDGDLHGLGEHFTDRRGQVEIGGEVYEETFAGMACEYEHGAPSLALGSSYTGQGNVQANAPALIPTDHVGAWRWVL